jgi:hypothetical protein
MRADSVYAMNIGALVQQKRSHVGAAIASNARDEGKTLFIVRQGELPLKMASCDQSASGSTTSAILICLAKSRVECNLSLSSRLRQSTTAHQFVEAAIRFAIVGPNKDHCNRQRRLNERHPLQRYLSLSRR